MAGPTMVGCASGGDDSLGPGFLGTQATFSADLTLLLELTVGLMLSLGAWLARRRHYGAHAWCQSAMVLLNLPVIAVAMLPPFHERVLVGVPAKLGKAYYGLATAHATLAAVTEVAALYILLSAGTELLPPKWRIARYKLWMGSVLTLWWVALLLGVTTYMRWYVPHLFRK